MQVYIRCCTAGHRAYCSDHYGSGFPGVRVPECGLLGFREGGLAGYRAMENPRAGLRRGAHAVPRFWLSAAVPIAV